MKEYYFITVFEKFRVNGLGWFETGARRCWGFYCDKDTALRALHENWTDMNETVYSLAVLEGYAEGISHPTGYVQWFKFDREKDGYFEIEPPEGSNRCMCYSIG